MILQTKPEATGRKTKDPPPFFFLQKNRTRTGTLRKDAKSQGNCAVHEKTTRLLKEAYFRRGKRTVRNLRVLMGLKGDSCTYKSRV